MLAGAHKEKAGFDNPLCFFPFDQASEGVSEGEQRTSDKEVQNQHPHLCSGTPSTAASDKTRTSALSRLGSFYTDSSQGEASSITILQMPAELGIACCGHMVNMRTGGLHSPGLQQEYQRPFSVYKILLQKQQLQYRVQAAAAHSSRLTAAFKAIPDCSGSTHAWSFTSRSSPPEASTSLGLAPGTVVANIRVENDPY